MSRDYFRTLGLAHGEYAPAEIECRFQTARKELLADAAREGGPVLWRRLDSLHLAYQVLRDPRLQSRHLAQISGQATDPVPQFQLRIAGSLEDGLLRHTRRQELLDEGRRIGLNEFQVQLLIAQTQVGEQRLRLADPTSPSVNAAAPTRFGMRIAAAGLLAIAFLFAMIRAI